MRNKRNLISWMIGLLSFMFILNGSAFAASQSQYEMSIDIPTYDPNDPTHILITESNGKWSSSNLNSSAYKHFYIEPGKYHTKITLTADGSENKRVFLHCLKNLF